MPSAEIGELDVLGGGLTGLGGRGGLVQEVAGVRLGSRVAL